MRPKVCRFRKCTASYPKEFQHDGRVLYYTLCEKTISFERSDHIKQHRDTKEHKQGLGDMRGKKQSLLDPITIDSDSETD